MGKAAENERIKLRATWFNNVSVGLFITGVLVPYLAFVQGAVQLSKFGDYAPLLAAAFAFFGSVLFHGQARKELAKLQD
jgi:hypothetical protein